MADSRVEAASEEFALAELGDARLTRRLMTIADSVAGSPGVGFPRLVSGDGELEGVYRFLGNERVTPKGILAPHFAATRERAGDGDVLVVHDTTTFKFGGWLKREGLGRLRSGAGQGFFGHFAIAVSADGQRRPLGVVGLKAVVRGKQPRSQRIEKAGAGEFDRWADLALQVQTELPKAIHVMDREADAVSIFDALVGAGARFVIRLCHDRVLARDSDDEPRLLYDALASGETMLTREVPLSRRNPTGTAIRRTHPARAERNAKLRIQATTVAIKGHGRNAAPLRLNAVLVQEVGAPDYAEPVEWKLLTNLPIDTPEQVAAIVDAYRARWMIEEFFKALKSGCAYEKRQLETFRALVNALAIFSVIAWRLLLLRYVSRSRPDAPAVEALTPRQVRLLQRLSTMKGPGVPAIKMPPNPTAADALLAVARLGGHIANNGAPGWQVLGRGYDSMLLMELGWRAAQAPPGEM